MKRTILLALAVFLLAFPIHAKVNLSLSAGADFSRNLLYEEDILFRTSGRFALTADASLIQTSKFSASPYVKLSYLTHTMTFSNARTLGSCSISGGLKARSLIKEKIALTFSLGAGAGMYNTYNYASAHDGKNDSLISFGTLEAGVGAEAVLGHFVLSSELGAEWRRDSVRWFLSAGMGVWL